MFLQNETSNQDQQIWTEIIGRRTIQQRNDAPEMIDMFNNAQTSNNVQTSIHEQTSKHDAPETKETFYIKINVQTSNQEQTSLQSRGESMHVTPISKGTTWDKYKNKQNPDKLQYVLTKQCTRFEKSTTNKVWDETLHAKQVANNPCTPNQSAKERRRLEKSVQAKQVRRIEKSILKQEHWLDKSWTNRTW